MDLMTLDSAGFQKYLDAGLLTSVELVQACLAQIDKHDQRGAQLNAMISIVPYQLLMERSEQLDRERAAGRVRSSFHGIPLLIKVCSPCRRSRNWLLTFSRMP
jgi:amidase